MSADSSYSRNYLTTSNNHFEPIHYITDDSRILAERKERNDRLIRQRTGTGRRGLSALVKAVPSQSSSSPHTQALEEPRRSSLTENMSFADEEDVNRLPESSDEENIPPAHNNNSADDNLKGNKRKGAISRTIAGSEEIEAEGTRRSKRQKITDNQKIPSTMPEKPSAPKIVPDLFLSQLTSSQERSGRRGLPKKYGGSQFRVPSLTPEKKMEAKSDLKKLQPISRDASPEVESHAGKRTKPEFKNVSSSPSAPSASRPRPRLKDIGSSPLQAPEPARTIFQNVESTISDGEADSKTASIASRSNSSEKPEVQNRKRRGSTSSLSSTDSLIEYQLDTSQKAALMSSTTNAESLTSGPDLPPNHISCPICRRPTSLQDLPNHNPKINPATLPLRKQTEFCHEHRVRDAQSIWAQSHYPTIDWDALPSSDSLQTHIKALIPIVRRKAPSHYLSKLDAAVTNARGNQSEINRAFDVAHVHHGYYGPRGAQIVMNAIMANDPLQKVLSRQLRSDKTMRIANLGRLTDCVLLPEVLTRLVQEDMVLGKREEAGDESRKILEDSVDIGLLLCADEDEVDGGYDDDL